MITSIQDIDQIEFLEDYLGVKLLMYQKEILRRMLSKDKNYIHPLQSYERPSIRMINVIRKCYSLILDDVDKQILQVKKLQKLHRV